MSDSVERRSLNRCDLLKSASVGFGALALDGIGSEAASGAAAAPNHWEDEADVVVIGSGAVGLPAEIVARQGGASVIVVEAENHVGGHAIVSGGTIPLGGGTSAQKKYGIVDSPDQRLRQKRNPAR